MKKTYINPNIAVVKIATNHQMLTTSDATTGTKFDPTSSVGQGGMEGHSDDFDW